MEPEEDHNWFLLIYFLCQRPFFKFFCCLSLRNGCYLQIGCCARWTRDTLVQEQAIILELWGLCNLMRPKGLRTGVRPFSWWRAVPAGARWIYIFWSGLQKEKMIYFHTLMSGIHLVLTQKFHVMFEAAKISLNIRSLSDWMRTWLHVSLTETRYFFIFKVWSPGDL